MKGKIEKLKEQSEGEKEKYDKISEKKDREITHLRQNISNTLGELSHEKEKSLNLELEL